MYGEGEFDDSGGLGLLLHAAHPATDVQDERAPPPTRASRQRGHTNSPEEVTGSLCSRVTRLKVSQSDGHQAASVSVSSKENLLLVLTCQAKVTYLFRRAAG